MAEMGKIAVNTWDFRGKKQIIETEKNCELATKQKGKMVQNADEVPEIGQNKKRTRQVFASNHLPITSYLRQKWVFRQKCFVKFK